MGDNPTGYDNDLETSAYLIDGGARQCEFGECFPTLSSNAEVRRLSSYVIDVPAYSGGRGRNLRAFMDLVSQRLSLHHEARYIEAFRAEIGARITDC